MKEHKKSNTTELQHIFVGLYWVYVVTLKTSIEFEPGKCCMFELLLITVCGNLKYSHHCQMCNTA